MESDSTCNHSRDAENLGDQKRVVWWVKDAIFNFVKAKGDVKLAVMTQLILCLETLPP